MVQMFTGRAELLDKGETTKEHTKNQKEEAEKLEQDKANDHPTQGGMFGGIFKPKATPLKPVIDLDDGVMRCPHCAWELEEGFCAACGYEYRPGEETDDSESEDYSETDLDSFDGLDEEGPMEGDSENMAEEGPSEGIFAEMNGQDLLWDDYARHHPRMQALPFQGPVPGRMQNLINHLNARPIPSPSRHHMVPGNGNSFYRPAAIRANENEFGEEEDDDDEDDAFYRPTGIRANEDEYGEEDDDDEDDEENEYDEADSFIDDEHNGVPTSPFIGNGHHDTSGEVYDEQSDTSTGTVVDDIHGGDPPSTDGVLQWRDSTPYIDEDSDESVEMTGVVPGSDESSSEEEVVQAAPSRRRHPQFASRSQFFQAPSEAPWLTARAPAVPDSDEEVESEESETSSSPPPRRPSGRAFNSGTTAGNAITLDDTDDDQPVGPVRRNTHRRRMRFSPY